MTEQIRIAPSVLSADLVRLEEQIKTVEQAGADWIHVDVMDGRFVPSLTFGANMIEALRRVTDLPLDVHLMVEEPEAYIEAFSDAGATVFTFHPEATVHVQRHLAEVRARGMLAGLALNPSTPLSAVEEVIGDLDLLLIMSVNPGYGGQQFIPGALGKVERARALLTAYRSKAYLEVDGGISPDTIAAVHSAGADTFVAGSAIFRTDDPGTALRVLRKSCRQETLV